MDEDNIFSANLTENNKVEQIKFKKSTIYAISELSIDQDTQFNVFLTNVEGKKVLSDILRTYTEEKTKFNLDLKIYKEIDINVAFQKRIDVLINGFQYYDTTTQKQETIQFYDYYCHLKKFGFTWEHTPLELKYEITLSADEKTLTKKITMGKNTRFKFIVGESRMIYVTSNNNVASLSLEWVKEIPISFNIIKPGQVKDLRNIDRLDKETIRKNYNRKANNNLFYSKTIKTTRTHGNFKVTYLGPVFAHKIVVSKYYHDNVNKNF